ncbi:MAG: hypothetical protein WKF75_09410 [Singulisphaera sp.]
MIENLSICCAESGRCSPTSMPGTTDRIGWKSPGTRRGRRA